MATVRTRVGRDGKPHYDVRYRDPNGVQRKRSFGRKRDAMDYAASVETDKLRGAYVDRNAGRETFRTFADRWLAAQLFAPSTRSRVASDLRNHIYPVLGDRPLAAIRPSTGPGLGPVAVSSGAEHAAPDLRIRRHDPGRCGRRPARDSQRGSDAVGAPSPQGPIQGQAMAARPHPRHGAGPSGPLFSGGLDRGRTWLAPRRDLRSRRGGHRLPPT